LAVLKLLRLGGHLLGGVLTVLVLFPRLDGRQRGRRVSRWALRMLTILDIRVVCRGPTPTQDSGGALLVSNHVSWLDIHVLHSLLPVRFVSKSEIRDWPLIGWLAVRVGTVFLTREKRSDTRRVNQLMVQHLRDRDLLALFPEGTTSDGRELLPFYPSLFQPVVEARAPIWPARLRYLDAQGQASEAAAYHGGMSLADSLWRVLRQRGITVEVEFLPRIPYQEGLGRRELAHLCETLIRETPAAVGRAPERSVHLPA